MGLIRLILALSVVAMHCGGIFSYKYVNGEIAVQSFYIISGFYMTMIINEKYIGKNGSYKLFITNRLLRLYPLYWTVLALVLTSVGTVALVKGLDSVPDFKTFVEVKHTIVSALVLGFSNIFIVGTDALMFTWLDPSTGQFSFTENFWLNKPPIFLFIFLPQIWTVGLEITFYLIAPFIVKRTPAVVGTLIVLTLLLRLYMYQSLGLKHDPWTYRFFPTELMFFLIGYFCYKAYIRIKSKELPQWITYTVFAAVILFSVFYSFLPVAKAENFPFSYKEIAYFLLLIVAIPLLFKFFKKSKFDQQIGELSYPVYISHFFVAFMCYASHIRFLGNGTMIAVCTLIFSYLLNRFVALPIEKYRQARVK